MILFKIIGIVILWFIVGAIINFICYAGKSQSYMQQEKSSSAKLLHMVANALTLLAIIGAIFN